MARKRQTPQDELLEEAPVLVHRHRKHDTSDPREPLPEGTTTGEVVRMDANDKQTAENLASAYARALVAYDGNIEKALAKVFKITEEEALNNMVELHDRARGASRVNTNMTDMMERHDLTTETRLAKLREHMFSPIPAVSLKAIDAITELDSTAKSKRIGTTWETFVARVRQGAGPKAQQQRALASGKKTT